MDPHRPQQILQNCLELQILNPVQIQLQIVKAPHHSSSSGEEVIKGRKLSLHNSRTMSGPQWLCMTPASLKTIVALPGYEHHIQATVMCSCSANFYKCVCHVNFCQNLHTQISYIEVTSLEYLQ